MPETGAAGSRRSPRRGSATPPPITPFDPVGEILAADNRAAARAALADSFAARFGIDDDGPSAAALADRFGFRYEGGELPTGRRTVTITGHGAARAVPPAERSVRGAGVRDGRRGPRRGLLGPGLRADRVALLAVGLGLLLAFLAATSAHAATLAVPR